MAAADGSSTTRSEDTSGAGWSREVRIPVAGPIRRLVDATPRDSAGRVAHLLGRAAIVAFLLGLAVGGLALAVAGALVADRTDADAVGALGLEAGAAMWFAGAVTLGARPKPTLLRLVLLAATGVGGLALIVAAFVGDWSGVALDLAMEFGVGALAIVVLDIAILGIVQTSLDRLGPPTGPAPITST
jgi:hypothetical protein